MKKKKKMYLAFTVQPENMLKVVILTDPQNINVFCTFSICIFNFLTFSCCYRHRFPRLNVSKEIHYSGFVHEQHSVPQMQCGVKSTILQARLVYFFTNSCLAFPVQIVCRFSIWTVTFSFVKVARLICHFLLDPSLPFPHCPNKSTT